MEPRPVLNVPGYWDPDNKYDPYNPDGIVALSFDDEEKHGNWREPFDYGGSDDDD